MYEHLTEGHEDDKVYCTSIATMLRTAQSEAGTYTEVRVRNVQCMTYVYIPYICAYVCMC